MGVVAPAAAQDTVRGPLLWHGGYPLKAVPADSQQRLVHPVGLVGQPLLALRPKQQGCAWFGHMLMSPGP